MHSCMSTTGLARELKYDSLGGVDGASDGGEQGPARAVELGGATVRGAGAERRRHQVRSDRGVNC